MVGRHSLAGSAHAHGITAQDPAHLYLLGRLIGRSCQLYIDSLLKPDIQLPGSCPDYIAQRVIIYLAHIRKSWPQFIQVLPNQRRRHKAGNLVPDQHKIPCRIIMINPARSVGQEQDFRPHQLHKPDRKYHIRHGIPLIIMHTPLHHDHRHTIDMCKYKPPLMAGYR